jgi:hypothetical protein
MAYWISNHYSWRVESWKQLSGAMQWKIQHTTRTFQRSETHVSTHIFELYTFQTHWPPTDDGDGTRESTVMAASRPCPSVAPSSRGVAVATPAHFDDVTASGRRRCLVNRRTTQTINEARATVAAVATIDQVVTTVVAITETFERSRGLPKYICA